MYKTQKTYGWFRKINSTFEKPRYEFKGYFQTVEEITNNPEFDSKEDFIVRPVTNEN
jgi:hypothetical protein